MKTSQTAILCGIALLAAAAVVAGDFLVHRHFADNSAPADQRGPTSPDEGNRAVCTGLPTVRAVTSTSAPAEHDRAVAVLSSEREPTMHGLAGIPQRVRISAHATPIAPLKQRVEPNQFRGTRVVDFAVPTASGLWCASLERCWSALETLRIAESVVLNNIANASTPGFKRSRVLLGDLGYEYRTLPGATDDQGKLSSIGIHVGMGNYVAGTALDLRQGGLRQTGNMLELAIVGSGFFQLWDGPGILYTRAGGFSLNADGDVVLSTAARGRMLEPQITIPADATDILINTEGSISVRQSGSQQLTQVGQLQLARFVNPQGLIQVGDNLFRLTDASGQPQIGTPGADGLGEVRSGFLESSNVNLEVELVELRRLESTRRALQSALQLLAPDTAGVGEADLPHLERAFAPPQRRRQLADD